MPQVTDADLILAADEIANETAVSGITKTEVADLFKNVADSKPNNDKIDTDPTLATASKTLPGRDAVKAYIAQAVGALVASSPEALDTLNELAAALGNDPNFSTTVLNALTDLQGQIDDLETQDLAQITGATTLDATAWGKVFICSGTLANYTILLPTAVGNAGKSIGFVCAHDLTKLVTIDGHLSETLAGELVRSIWAKETLVVMSDGTNWIVPVYKGKAMSAAMSEGAQSIPNNVQTRLIFNSVTDNTGLQFGDLANNRFNILRPGFYKIEIKSTPANHATQACPFFGMYTFKNGVNFTPVLSTTNVPTINQTTQFYDTTVAVPLIAGDQIDMRVYHNTTGAAPRVISGSMIITEIL